MPPDQVDSTPWLDTFCYLDEIVPAGCPVRIVTADAAPLQLEVVRWHGYNDTLTVTPSTTTAQGSSVEVVVGGEGCGMQFNDSIQFDRYEVMAPALAEGDSFFVRYETTSGPVDSVSSAPKIGPAGECPTADWSTTHWVSCLLNADAGVPGGDEVGVPPASDGGCSVGGGTSFATALVIALIVARRYRCG